MARRVDDRLVMDIEFAPVEPGANLGLQGLQAAALGVEIVAIDAHPALAFRLGRGHGEVRAAHQVVETLARRGHGQAEAGADGHGMGADSDRFGQLRFGRGGEACGDIGRFGRRHQKGELVATQPGQKRAPRTNRAQTRRHDGDQPVARVVAIGVVDRLETIEIQYRHGRGHAGGATVQAFQPFHQGQPVGQAAKPVGAGAQPGALFAGRQPAHAPQGDDDEAQHQQADQHH